MHTQRLPRSSCFPPELIAMKTNSPSANRSNGNFDLFDDSRDDDRHMNTSFADASDFIVDIREYDVPYHVRVLIDLGMTLQNSLS